MVGKQKTSTKNSNDQEDNVTGNRKNSTRNKSPARNKNPGRGSSPGRSKSTERSRSPGRPKSPSRNKKNVIKSSEKSASPRRKNPSRSSPSRIIKSEEKERALKTSKKQKLIVDSESESDLPEPVQAIKEKPKATVRGRTRRIDIEFEGIKQVNLDEVETPEVLNSYDLIKRVTRSQNRDVERVVHLRHFEAVSKKLGEFSDEDDISVSKSTPLETSEIKGKHITEFGGWLGALFLMILTTVSIVALHMVCDQYQCSFLQLPSLQKYTSLSTFFDSKSILVYVAYFTVLAILCALPFGGKRVSGLPNKHQKLEYVMNGLFSTAIIFAVAVGLELKGIALADFMTEHLFHLLIASLLVGYALAVYAYIRSFYVPVSALNTHICSKSAIYNFFMGREVNPRIGGVVDLKMFVLRLSLIGSLLINFAYLYKSLGLTLKYTDNNSFDLKSLNIQPTLLVYILIHTIYLLDPLIFESSWVTSFEVQHEGFGFMGAVGYSIYPFMSASVVKYIVEYDVKLAPWKLVLTFIVFIVGYVLFRGSNSQKDAFRKNPYSPALAHLETIPTTQGKKLIVSGFWGIVRHPNYLGDILINLSYAPFVLCVFPVIVIYSIILLLIHRSVRDNARCKQKYGSAWNRYCNKVKYVLVPKVY